MSAAKSQKNEQAHNEPIQVETVKIQGWLDKGPDDVDRLLATGKTDIILDFSLCPFITVDGLEWLEELLLRAASMERSVRLVHIPPTIYKVFKVSRIDCILKACGAPAATSGPVC